MNRDRSTSTVSQWAETDTVSPSQRLKVLYVGGEGRSGSTIMGGILGHIDGFFAVGEMGQVWRRGLIENWRCSCGAPFRECPVWQEVLTRAFGNPTEIDAEELLLSRRRGPRTRHLLPVADSLRILRKRMALMGVEYLQAIERLYHAVHSVSQSRVIIDTSKGPAYGYILGAIPTIDLYILHLVRDPRAVAYSWAKRRKPEPSLEGHSDNLMARRGNIELSFSWNEWNYTIERTWGHNSERYMLMRYEDFVRNPKGAIERCLRFLGEEASQLPFISDRQVMLGKNHVFSGNPDRFEDGVVTIKANDEWKNKMSTYERTLVTSITSPWLVRYGYPLFP